MLSKTCSIALLSFFAGLSAAVAQPDNTNRAGGVNESVREAPDNQDVARQNDGRTGPAINQDELELEVRPEDPEIDTGVYEPTDFTIPGYGSTEVSLRWWNRGGPQTRISRRINGGEWTLLQTFGALPTGGYVDFQDRTATIDAENCYRVSVWDGVNAFTGKTSPIRCAWTRDGRNLAARRVQLRIQIANAEDAGTDNTIEVRLQPTTDTVYAAPYWRPAGNSTWVDSTADDFERSSSKTYDLMTSNISEVSDIVQIVLLKPGDDDVCIAALQLFIDNQSVYQHSYGNGPSGCRWIHGNDRLSVDFAALRAHTSWRNLTPNPTFTLDGPALRSVIEANFGHFLHGRGELRNSGGVRTTFADRQRINVSVPVTVYDAPILGDVDSTIHFDLALTEVDSTAQLAIENVDADSNDLLGFFLPLIGWAILNGTSEEIESQINGMSPTNLGGSTVDDTHLCFTETAGIGICYDGT